MAWKSQRVTKTNKIRITGDIGFMKDFDLSPKYMGIRFAKKKKKNWTVTITCITGFNGTAGIKGERRQGL
jgi:hypothetical protein